MNISEILGGDTRSFSEMNDEHKFAALCTIARAINGAESANEVFTWLSLELDDYNKSNWAYILMEAILTFNDDMLVIFLKAGSSEVELFEFLMGYTKNLDEDNDKVTANSRKISDISKTVRPYVDRIHGWGRR